MAVLYRVNNGISVTTAPSASVTTGTSATKTMLQVLHPNQPLTVIEWGISFDGSAVQTPIKCELIQTTTIAATVTAFAANDVTTYNEVADAGVTAAGLTLSTSGSGFTASAEGSIVAPVRSGDYQLVAPTNQYVKQFPLGQGFKIPAAGVLRIRITPTLTTAVNAVCYVIFGVGGD